MRITAEHYESAIICVEHIPSRDCGVPKANIQQEADGKNDPDTHPNELTKGWIHSAVMLAPLILQRSFDA
jgi:hypothetical protein